MPRLEEDEFACSGMLRGVLSSLHATVERIFGVAFTIGADDPSASGNDGQIWLKLRGPGCRVGAAKVFVRGLVNQEERQQVSYPAALHCIFCGARGLFMDCLTRNTAARIRVSSPGLLFISGLAEPVVRAYSLITDLVERCEGTPSGRPEAPDRGPAESLDSRRAFKTLVEEREDNHILDLLVLPGSVKEILLDLVRESGLESSLGPAPTDGRAESDDEDPEVVWVKPYAPPEPARTTERWVEGVTASPEKDPEDSLFRSGSGGTRGRAEGGPALSPQEAGGEQQESGSETKEPAVGNKEFWLLLKFFTAMGYTEDVVKRVIARTGPKEASEILDVVQQEQDRSDRQQAGGEEEEMEEEEEEEEEMEEEEAGGEEGGHEEDFVLGVVKKAAASCGYMEQEVAKVYGMLPERSTHRLLLELQREAAREAALGGGGEAELIGAAEKRKSEGPDVAAAEFNKFRELPEPRTPRPVVAPEVKGPPTASYPSAPDLPLANVQSDKHYGQSDFWPDRFTSKPDPPTRGRVPDPEPQPSPAVLKQAFQAPPPPPAFFFARNDSPPLRARERRGFGSSVVVTGEQRFLEGLRVTFDLRLTDKPGDPTLRMVVIDGSNVAMSHGLGNFFSCRGIALAVQHFWDRGHRDISAMLPQWRQKSDPKNKEQHYLSELQQLGLLSYTPSREVLGKRISSYDDRLMLQLAQKKDGVIVTNDNLRDLLDESAVWRDIIKKRILQYTFVGDLFMVPDDPLGRGGPHLDNFLRSEHRTPDPGNRSFAGVATMFPSSTPPPCSQTALLNFRDRTLEGALTNGAAFGGGRGKGKAQAKGWGPGHLLGVRADRTPQETASLREQLRQVFPGQDHAVALVLRGHPAQTDMNVLSDLILEQ